MIKVGFSALYLVRIKIKTIYHIVKYSIVYNYGS